jgi:hypothetical protein
MPPMKTDVKKSSTYAAFAFALAGLSACGGGGGSGDQTAKFVGSWTFQSGMLTGTCPAVPGLGGSFPLAGLGAALMKVDDSTVELVASGGSVCKVKFQISGDKATAPSGQTCSIDTKTALQEVLIGVDSWTLTVAGDTLASDTKGSFLAGCTASGSGVLVRATGDGGAD